MCNEVRCKTLGRIVGTLLMFALAPFAVVAAGCGGRNEARVTKHVEYALEDLNATPDQRARILAVKDRLLESVRTLRTGHKATRQALFAAWKSEAPDAASLHALVDQRVEELRTIAHQAVDALVEVHGVLTPEQRSQVTRKIERWHR